MFEFFLRQPLWAKAAMVAGAGATGYGLYHWWSGPNPHKRRVHRDGLGPVEAAAGLAPAQAAYPQMPAYASTYTPAYAEAPATPAQYSPELIETATYSPYYSWWDETTSRWIDLPEREWQRRYSEHLARYGTPPPAPQHPTVSAQPAPLHPAMRPMAAAHPTPPMARPVPHSASAGPAHSGRP
jgi:hypothetical protein